MNWRPFFRSRFFPVAASTLTILCGIHGAASSSMNSPLNRYRVNDRSRELQSDSSWQDEVGISFDGTNLEDIQTLAWMKAQNNPGSPAPPSDSVTFCDANRDTEAHSVVLEWDYSVEYETDANVEEIMQRLEQVLLKRAAGLILVCNNEGVQYASIVGATEETDSPVSDGACTPKDTENNSCKAYVGRLKLFLSDKTTEQKARFLGMSSVQEVLARRSFVIEVGLGLISVKFGRDSLNVPGEISDIESISEDSSDGSTLMIVSVASAFSVLVAIIGLAWRNSRMKLSRDRLEYQSSEEAVSANIGIAPCISLESGGDGSIHSKDADSANGSFLDGEESSFFPGLSERSLSAVPEVSESLLTDSSFATTLNGEDKMENGGIYITNEAMFTSQTQSVLVGEQSPSSDHLLSPFAVPHSTLERTAGADFQHLVSLYRGAPASPNFGEDDDSVGVLGIHRKFFGDQANHMVGIDGSSELSESSCEDHSSSNEGEKGVEVEMLSSILNRSQASDGSEYYQLDP